MYTKRVANYSSFSNFQHSFTIFLHLFLFGLMSYRTWITLLPASAPSLLLRTRSKATTTVALSHFSPAKLFKTGFLNYRRRPESPSSKGCQAFPHFCFLLYNVTYWRARVRQNNSHLAVNLLLTALATIGVSNYYNSFAKHRCYVGR
ncbi:hypothetical protein ECG_09006 [Echinococcus granulosus]|uniref:Expressed protein n=1 Tax=Echinococcus granulosus TaxID=6210 RepID=A0A068WUN1_ECHGR|nr:hypothetical protein ECG_09006 [Echinococcus granulosus]CDS21394.1 expressed protein [Echinococcus granulosus]